MIVDDSPAVRTRVASMVREVDGVSAVSEASDADEALALAQAAGPDVVVLDLHIPGGGLRALAALKSGSPEAPPVVIVLTNDVSDHHRQRCLALGADHFFDKSSDVERALAILTELARSAR